MLLFFLLLLFFFLWGVGWGGGSKKRYQYFLVGISLLWGYGYFTVPDKGEYVD